MPSFFIDRPIFAWVLAILISLVGVIAMLNMGIESYPDIAPPQVTVTRPIPAPAPPRWNRRSPR
jgi:multidrug efflux pump